MKRLQFRWDPSVRTRHVLVILALSLTALGLLCGFSLTRLLGVKIAAKHRAQESLADALFSIAQHTINEQPNEEETTLLREERALATLLQAQTGAEREFTYTALLTVDGATLLEADPQQRRNPGAAPRPIEEFENAVWTRQLWHLFVRGDTSYELRTQLKLNNQPFAVIIAGVTAAQLRRELRAPLLLTLAFAGSLVGLILLGALLSSPFILRPLRDLIASIEQLEAEASAASESAEPVDNAINHPHNITQRLRILGRRFAGNRTELEMTRDQLRQVIGGLSERVILLDREQRVLLASPEAERLLGGNLARGRQLNEMLGSAHPLVKLTARAYSSGESLQEVAPLSANGGEPQMISAAVQLFKDRMSTAGALLALRDSAVLERLETQIDFATKVAALNRITTGVAHEVKNPLHAMVLHLELLNAKLASGADPRVHVEILVSEVQRLNRVVQTFLDFNRPVELRPVSVDANLLVREVLRLAGDARAPGIEIVEDYADEPLLVNVDADLLKQALLNIVINGSQAMEGGGRLEVETSRTAEGGVQISVRDHGPGIPPEIREKIFNLYFTTKPKGSGIGLAQAFRAVQLHNGRIEVESEPGEGACFRIILPAA